MEEAKQLLHDIIALFKNREEAHNREIIEFRTLYLEQTRHHEDEVSELHKLLVESEQRIKDTNEMVRKLSDTCEHANQVYGEHIKRVATSRDLALESNVKLLAENERLLKENEAYYKALKEERERYDNAMKTVINAYSQSKQPLVKIDQK